MVEPPSNAGVIFCDVEAGIKIRAIGRAALEPCAGQHVSHTVYEMIASILNLIGLHILIVKADVDVEEIITGIALTIKETQQKQNTRQKIALHPESSIYRILNTK